MGWWSGRVGGGARLFCSFGDSKRSTLGIVFDASTFYLHMGIDSICMLRDLAACIGEDYSGRSYKHQRSWSVAV